MNLTICMSQSRDGHEHGIMKNLEKKRLIIPPLDLCNTGQWTGRDAE